MLALLMKTAFSLEIATSVFPVLANTDVRMRKNKTILLYHFQFVVMLAQLMKTAFSLETATSVFLVLVSIDVLKMELVTFSHNDYQYPI